MNEKVLIVDFDRCDGCRLCELRCSLTKERSTNPTKSRVRIMKNEGEGIDVPVMCINCADAPCAKVCPVEAIVRDSNKGVFVIYDKCIGCMKCVEACPYGAMFFNPQKKVAFNCDLCEGDPACVKICGLRVPPPNSTIESVIKYIPVKELGPEKLEVFIKSYRDVIKKAK